MGYNGRTQWALMFVCPGELEAEADRLLDSHAEWMERTHYREGEKALLQYTVTKGTLPDRDGVIVYAMTEVYQSPAGEKDHHQQAEETWEDYAAMWELLGKCEGPWGLTGTISHSLW